MGGECAGDEAIRSDMNEKVITYISLVIKASMKKYLIIIEDTTTGYSAYSPDFEGCVATGSTRDEVEKNMREAISFHLEGLKSEGCIIPQPHSYSAFVEVRV